MNHDEHPANPEEARRKGLEQLSDHPHHETTEETHAGASRAPIVNTPPTEEHRGGPLPNMKR